MYTTRSWTL